MYAMFTVEGDGTTKVDEMLAPCVQVYADVEDIPTALVKVEQMGGKTVNSKTEIDGDMGWHHGVPVQPKLAFAWAGVV